MRFCLKNMGRPSSNKIAKETKKKAGNNPNKINKARILFNITISFKQFFKVI